MALQLVAPHERWRETFLRGLRELRAEGLPWHVAVDLDAVERDFSSFVASKATDADATHLWAIDDDAFVGRLSIRRALTDALRIEGGNIGYDTVPSFRGRGVATEMLRLALPLARAIGLTEVLITCDDTNVASICVIERNGGVLRETKLLDPRRPLKRYYWITLA